MRTKQRRGASAEEAVLRLVQDHAAELLRFAGRFSHCADDAHDAYQRALEILVRRMRAEPPEQPLSWTRTVLRREALAVRAEREQLVGRFEVDVDRQHGRHLDDPVERAVRQEQLHQAAEALQRLKPQEVTALSLRAQGLSYKEICSQTGWSYTKCNRAVTEGRRALTERLGEIRSGAECDRWAPLLSALADGEAGHRDLLEVRPHLRSCAGCRATLRAYHAAPAQVAALVPPALVPFAAEPGSSLLGHAELALHALTERASLAALRVQGALEGMSGAKVAAVAASTAAIAGGGAAIEQATRAGGDPARPDRAVAAAAAPAAARLAVPGLMTIAGAPAARRGAPGSARRSEFAAPRPRARPSEFSRRPAAPAEFAPDASSTAAVAAAASAAAAAPAPASAPATPPSREPPEFFAP